MSESQEYRFSYLDDGQIYESVAGFLEETGKDPARILSLCLSAFRRASDTVNQFELCLKENLQGWEEAGKNVRTLLDSFSDGMPGRDDFFGTEQIRKELCRKSAGLLIAFDEANRTFRERSVTVCHLETSISDLLESIVRAEGLASIGQSALRTLGIEKKEMVKLSADIKQMRTLMENRIPFFSSFRNRMMTYFSKRCNSFGTELEKGADIENNGKNASPQAVWFLVGQIGQALNEFLSVAEKRL